MLGLNLVGDTGGYSAGVATWNYTGKNVDNGCGATVGGGFGLRAMRQRAENIGGSVIVESSPGQGNTLVVQLPIVNEIHHEENEILDEK